MTNRRGTPRSNADAPVPSNPPRIPSGVSRPAVEVTDEMADRACVAFYNYMSGPNHVLTARDLGIVRQAWKYALKEALNVRFDPFVSV